MLHGRGLMRPNRHHGTQRVARLTERRHHDPPGVPRPLTGARRCGTHRGETDAPHGLARPSRPQDTATGGRWVRSTHS